MKAILFVGLGLWMTLLLACNKDDGPSNCEKLEGAWQLESWQEDAVELFGDTIYITSAELEFKVLTGDQGDYTLNLNYLLGGPETVIGAYVVNEDCDQVTLTPKGGIEGEVYDFHFEGDLLFMEGTINTVMIELEFKKTD